MNCQNLLDRSDPHAHFVQLYTDVNVLADSVGQYLASGLNQGDAALVIASADHSAAFRMNLSSRGVDVCAAEADRHLIFLDAAQTLARCTAAGIPDWDRFRSTISVPFASLRPSTGRGVRAYGEMVGILWTSGEYSAAIRIEEFWNRALAACGASLFCSYPIDVLGPEFESTGVHAILCDHTHLLPTDRTGALEKALKRAIAEVVGEEAPEPGGSLDTVHRPAWGVVPRAESTILWLRENLPLSASDILWRASQDYAETTSARPA